MSRRVGVTDFSLYAADMIRKFGDEARDALEESINEVAKETVKKLKTDPMPFKKRTGDYSKDWTWKAIKKRLKYDAVVFNKDHYQLTHLLEFGHAKQNGGRTKAFSHIEPINEWVQTELIDRFLDKIAKV